MAEKNYGELCKECGEYHTKHPSGICSRCRKLKGSKPCIVCGTHKTVAPDGLCSACRIKTLRKKNGGVSIEKAIEDTELLLAMLKNRANGYVLCADFRSSWRSSLNSLFLDYESTDG